MPTEDDDNDPDAGTESNPVRQLREQNKNLERQLVEAKEAAKANADLERRLAISEAGIGDHPMRELFVDAYKGEMTKEAVREAAQKYGLPVGGSSAAPTPAQQQQQQQRTADINTNVDIDEALGGGDGGGEEFAVYQRELDECQGDPAKIQKVIQKYGHHVKLLSDID